MNEETLFAEALKRSDPAERAAFLEQACETDTALRRRIEELLRAHDRAGGLLDKPAATLEGTSDAPPGQWLNPDDVPQTPHEGVGSRIKEYKLLQQIGEGGMGVVFMAEQQQPVRRMVALKVIKAGMDSAQVIARFEQERQALALMDHPNIAKVLDAGTTQSGRPFFVMELVKGIPITKYCDEQRLSPKQRLELFVPVCQAIQHAHQKGIIHRDIKPSNVLIAAYDGRPVPKVIDFGVAKATGQKLTERTLFTGFGGLVGTLEYMSPEQAEFNALDIDTRSDVYSLGVMLYELLTGSTPLTRQRIKDAAIMEILRLIREEEPPRPSTRLLDSKDSLASVSAQRHSEPAALVKSVRGEVDWIVMKALDKDRTRRYETANGLARDIQRYLSEEAVEAGPPSARYRLRKLAWRHRRGLTTAAALLLLLVVGVVLSSILAAWALREEHLANLRLDDATLQKERAETAETQVREQLAAVQQQKERAEKAEAQAKGNEAKARRERAKAEQSVAATTAVLNYFRDKVLSAGRPEGQEGGLGPKVTLRQAVDVAERDIAKSFADRPLVEALIRNTLGTTYWHLGEYPQAIRQNERALELLTVHAGPEHPDTLRSRNNLANAYETAGRIEEAIRLHEQTLRQTEDKFGPNHLETLLSRNNLANAYWIAGRPADALRLLEQTLKQSEAKLGADHSFTLTARNNLANAYESAGRSADAIRLHEQNLKLCEAKLGAGHPYTLATGHNLAQAYQSTGRTADAMRLGEQTLKQMEAKLGPEHPDTLRSRIDLANAYGAVGRSAEAIRLHEQTLKQMEAKLGPGHPDTLRTRVNLGVTYRDAGRSADAIGLLEPTLKQMEAKLGPEHPDTLRTRGNLARAYDDAGRSAEAVRLQEQTLKQMETKLGLEHPNTLKSRTYMAEAYQHAGRTAEAIRLHQQNLKRIKAKLGPDHPHLALTLTDLGRCLLQDQKYAEAEPLLRDSLKIYRAKQPDNWNTFNTQSLLGGALLGQKKYADAEPLLLKGYQGMKQRESKIPPQGKIRLSEALQRLVQLYEATGKKGEADKWRQQLRTHQAAEKK